MKMKRWLSVLLAVVLLVCTVPMTASAAEALVAGTPLAVVPGAELTEVTFTPTETGVYSLASSYDDPSQSASPYL